MPAEYYIYRKPKQLGHGYSVHVRGTDGLRGFFYDDHGTVHFRRRAIAKPPDYGRFRVEERLPRLRSQSVGAPLRRTYGTAGHPRLVPKPPMTGAVSRARSPLRTQAKAMQQATGFASATLYARSEGKPEGVSYEWCHLIAHGFGGPDTPPNLVAATKHNNSEQLIIEGALSGFSDEPGVSVRVGATVLYDTFVAEQIVYDVFLDHAPVYSRTLNANYGAFPTHDMKTSIRADVRRSVCAALVARSPCDMHTPYDVACRAWMHHQYGAANVHG